MSAKQLSYDVVVEGMVIRVTHKPVRNINMRIGSDGVPQMSVPQHLSRTRATQLAHEHADWFVRAMAETRKHMQPGPTHWETGETVCWWGEELELVVVLSDNPASNLASCDVREGKLYMEVPELGTAADREWLFNEFCKYEIRARLVTLLPACEARVGRHATNISLRRMKTRWGSCTPKTGRIRLNTALAECPEPCLETVLVHELCHLRVSNHSAAFYACMDLYCPNWRVHQRWLDQHGPRAAVS